MAEFEFGFIHKCIIPQTNIVNINHGSVAFQQIDYQLCYRSLTTNLCHGSMMSVKSV